MLNRNTIIVLGAALATVVAVIAGNLAASRVHTEDDLARIAAGIPSRDAGLPGPPPSIAEQPKADTFDSNPFARRSWGKLVPNATQTQKVEQVKASEGPYRAISAWAFLLAKVIPCLAIFLLLKGYLDKQLEDIEQATNGDTLHESSTHTRRGISDGGANAQNSEGLPVRARASGCVSRVLRDCETEPGDLRDGSGPTGEATPAE